MDNLLQQLDAYSVDLDDFPVGAANVHDDLSLESEVNTLQSKVQWTKAAVLILQALTEVAKNFKADKDKIDNTHIAKYENDLVDDASAINHPRNMTVIADEAAALQEALEMQPEEMEQQSSSCYSLVERIKSIVPECSAAQLELLRIQNEITQKLREIQEMEYVLIKKKSKFAKDLVKQNKQLNKKKSSKDEGYERKSKGVRNIASEINKIKLITQTFIYFSPEFLVKKENFFDILENTRKPLNLATYSTQL